jgi:hypothetical protein
MAKTKFGVQIPLLELRIYLSVMGYTLMKGLRRWGLQATALATALGWHLHALSPMPAIRARTTRQ